MNKKYPFYLKSTVILFGLVLFTYAIFNLRDILIPLSFALLLAILLNPITNRLRKNKIPHVLAVAIALLVALVAIAGIVYFLESQMAGFSHQLPAFKKKFAELFAVLEQGINRHFGVAVSKQDQYVAEARTAIKPWLGSTLSGVASTLGVVFLLPVYAFLFLYYKTLLLNFLYEVFSEENSADVALILGQTKKAVQSYMYGLVLEALIVATMNAIALMILGVQYAILLGVLGALLNVIPFIGGILAVALPLVIATVTKDGFSTQIWVILSYALIQFIDNHFLVPYIVSSRVKINALISIIAVLLGGAVWGVAGMFLSIPFVGILKIIFDRISDLKPWGKLLGMEVPTRHKGETLRAIKNKFTSSHRNNS
jgi:predicted PurR-regulated permease PerM